MCIEFIASHNIDFTPKANELKLKFYSAENGKLVSNAIRLRFLASKYDEWFWNG